MEQCGVTAKLLAILACPACDERPAVECHEGALHCPKCGRVYPIVNGIPIMLMEEATLAEGEQT